MTEQTYFTTTSLTWELNLVFDAYNYTKSHSLTSIVEYSLVLIFNIYTQLNLYGWQYLEFSITLACYSVNLFCSSAGGLMPTEQQQESVKMTESGPSDLELKRRQLKVQMSTLQTRKQNAVCVRRAYKRYGTKSNPYVILDGLNMTVPKGTMWVMIHIANFLKCSQAVGVLKFIKCSCRL